MEKISLNTSRAVIEVLMDVYEWGDVAECGKCGSVVIGAKHFADAVVRFWNGVSDSDDEEKADEISEVLRALLDQVVEVAPKSNDEFGDWHERNQHKMLPALLEYYHDFVCLKVEDIILRTDGTCPCFPTNAKNGSGDGQSN